MRPRLPADSSIPELSLSTVSVSTPKASPFTRCGLSREKTSKTPLRSLHKPADGQQDARERALEFRRLLQRFMDVCNAIEYAHSRGVLHRDLKPTNIMLGKYGETLVVDWGLAKAAGRDRLTADLDEQTLNPSANDDSAPTQVGKALGTPQYMSPEQAAGNLDRLGPTSDVYSLGATLYCLLTGKPPFTGGELAEVLRQVKQGEFVRLVKSCGRLPRSWIQFCLKAMALDPVARYQTVPEMSSDIERWLADDSRSATATGSRAPGPTCQRLSFDRSVPGFAPRVPATQLVVGGP